MQKVNLMMPLPLIVSSNKLLRVSAAIIDRLLSPIRTKLGKRDLPGTKPGTLLKHHIPIQTPVWDTRKARTHQDRYRCALWQQLGWRLRLEPDHGCFVFRLDVTSIPRQRICPLGYLYSEATRMVMRKKHNEIVAITA